jgi:predicted DNA-binding transcriptional regulator AlpA
MNRFSTREAAKKLGLHHATLAQYILAKKIPTPEAVTTGKTTTHLWTESEIEHVRQLLPKIANGRKTRYKKQSAKTKAPARVPVPHKKRKPKKKK